jgi:hypothetical protein
MKVRLAKETFSEERVWEALSGNYQLVKKLYAAFEKSLTPLTTGGRLRVTLKL